MAWELTGSKGMISFRGFMLPVSEPGFLDIQAWIQAFCLLAISYIAPQGKELIYPDSFSGSSENTGYLSAERSCWKINDYCLTR